MHGVERQNWLLLYVSLDRFAEWAGPALPVYVPGVRCCRVAAPDKTSAYVLCLPLAQLDLGWCSRTMQIQQ